MFGQARHGHQRSTGTLIAAAVVLAAASSALLIGGSAVRGPAPAPLPAHTFRAAPPRAAHQPTSRAAHPGPAATPRSAAPPAVVVGATQPSRVYVPSLGIDGAWVGEQVTHNALDIPEDVHRIGLSMAGGSPDGGAGTVLLAGHVNYIGQGAGVLAPLYRIQPGALVILTDQAGRVSRWRVTSLDDPLKADLDPALFTATGPRRLALVTCGGKVHHGQYERNVVATAVPEHDTGSTS